MVKKNVYIIDQNSISFFHLYLYSKTVKAVIPVLRVMEISHTYLARFVLKQFFMNAFAKAHTNMNNMHKLYCSIVVHKYCKKHYFVTIFLF